MIPLIKPIIESTCQPPSWQKQLSAAITSPDKLFAALNLPGDYLEAAHRSSKLFPLKVTQSYLDKIEKGNIADPLLRQILPLGEELTPQPGYSVNPVGDIEAGVAAGLLHKYPSRVLLMPTAACGVHCRYCFRRHYPYSDNKSSNNWQQAVEYIEKDSSIHEVILSGGDPFSLSNHKLFRLLERLDDIPHLHSIRFHTRYPVILPDRFNKELSDYLLQLRCKVILVLHCNHPNELDSDVQAALKLLNNNNITLLNQSVLLAGVNDNIDDLKQLSEHLFECNVLPYYLHQLDKVKGAQHFAVSDHAAKALISALRNQLSGYLIPRLVRENSGELSKQVLF